MLMLKDLAVDKELTAKEMAAVRGGTKFVLNGDIVAGDGSIISLGDNNKNTVNNSLDLFSLPSGQDNGQHGQRGQHGKHAFS
jgi:hypothetical protein